MNGFENGKARCVHFSSFFFPPLNMVSSTFKDTQKDQGRMFSKEITKKVLCASTAIKFPKQLRRRPGTHGQTERQTWQHCPFHCYPPTSSSRVGSAGPTIRTGKSSKKKPAKRFRPEVKRPACGCQQAKAKQQACFLFLFFRCPFNNKNKKPKKNFQLYQS